MSLSGDEPLAFQTKRIRHVDRLCYILLHGAGATANLLVAVVNVLSLRGSVVLRPNAGGTVSLSHVINAVADHILDRAEAFPNAFSAAANEFNVQETLATLPNLIAAGINPRFRGVDDIEATCDTAVLEAAGVRLLHGWLLDALHEPAANIVGQRSLNAVRADLRGSTWSTTQATLVQQWLTATSAVGLTPFGVAQLTATLRDGECAVVARGSSFFAGTKHRGVLHLLVTGQSLALQESANVVWQTLEDVSGALMRTTEAIDHARRPSRATAVWTLGMSAPTGSKRAVNAVPVSAEGQPEWNAAAQDTYSCPMCRKHNRARHATKQKDAGCVVA
jgi:hypothetical protein